MKSTISFRSFLFLMLMTTTATTYAQSNTEKIKAKWSVERFEIEKNKLRGVKNIQERIQNIHGKLTVSSNNTNGSLYSIQLPLQHNYNL